jgi:hypothetical protein
MSDDEIRAMRKTMTVAQRAALATVSHWGGINSNGMPADETKANCSIRPIDQRTLFGLCVRGLLSGGPDRVLRLTEQGLAVRE